MNIKQKIRVTALLLSAAAMAEIGCMAQTVYEKIVEIDRPVHDFGDILSSQGPVSCKFNVKNVSSRAISILNVASSCGCTDVSWTRETIAPGASGTISATYSNDEGEFNFDKALTAYISDVKKPIVLRLRGSVHESVRPVGELYPAHFGPIGLKSATVRGPNVEQGQPRSGEFKIANTGSKRICVTFKDISDGLSISLPPQSIAPGETADVSYTITPSTGKWGRQLYFATPLADGRSYPLEISEADGNAPKGAEALLSEIHGTPENGDLQFAVTSWTKDDFSGMSREQKASAARLSAKESSASFGRVKAGTKVKVSFELSNTGKADARIYAMDTDTPRLQATGDGFIKSGQKGSISATLDTAGLPSGEVLAILTLTTNCPSRPLINLYVTGFIR